MICFDNHISNKKIISCAPASVLSGHVSQYLFSVLHSSGDWHIYFIVL